MTQVCLATDVPRHKYLRDGHVLSSDAFYGAPRSVLGEVYEDALVSRRATTGERVRRGMQN